MANLSQIRRQKMLDYLNSLKKEQTDDESIREITDIENYIREKKFGLVWEEHSEYADDMLEENISILTEDVSKKIVVSENKKYNFIVEGDNLQSLYLLEKTHKKQIDIIYIDPPYNTGKTNDEQNGGYDDQYIDANDSFLHSKWLSFMEKRLKVARKLLKRDGVIFISIGKEEVASLRLLCDEIFGSKNLLGQLVRRTKTTSFRGNYFAFRHDYILVYCTGDQIIPRFMDVVDENSYTKIEKEGKHAGQKYTDDTAFYLSTLQARPNQRYFIECPDGELVIPQGSTMPSLHKDGEKCIPNDGDGVWRWSVEQYQRKKEYLSFKKSNHSPLLNQDGQTASWNVYTKSYYNEKKSNGNIPQELLLDFINCKGTQEMKKLGLSFPFPKPTDLIKFLIEITNKPKDITVLDFFAGSGTTGDAVLQLNEKDGGNRSFILCTNNEISEQKKISYFVDKGYIDAPKRTGTRKEINWKEKWERFQCSYDYIAETQRNEYQDLGICHSVTYPRIKTIITGKRIDGTIYSAGCSANLKYLKCDWLPRKPDNRLSSNVLSRHIKELIELQNGIDIDNTKNVLIMNKNDFHKYVMDDLNYCKIEHIWVNQNIFLTFEERNRLNILDFKYIPKEFFEQEVKNVDEYCFSPFA